MTLQCNNCNERAIIPQLHCTHGTFEIVVGIKTLQIYNNILYYIMFVTLCVFILLDTNNILVLYYTNTIKVFKNNNTCSLIFKIRE